MITLTQFLSEWTGKGVNLPEDKNPYGFQCVELVNEWLKELGLHVESFTNAQDFDDRMEQFNPGQLIWTKNTPTNIPSPGDIVVWQGTGLPFGHVAIFVHGDVNTFTSFDQNFPSGSLPHLQTHTYWNVEGWMHPKVLDPVIDPRDAKIAELTAANSTLTNTVASLTTTVSTLTSKILNAQNALK